MKQKIMNILNNHAMDHGCIECGGSGESIASEDFSVLADAIKELAESHISLVVSNEMSLRDNAVDFGKWLMKYAVYESRKYYNLSHTIGEYDKDDTYEMCDLYTIFEKHFS